MIKRRLRAAVVVEKKETTTERQKKDKYTVHIGGECLSLLQKIICSINWDHLFFSMDLNDYLCLIRDWHRDRHRDSHHRPHHRDNPHHDLHLLIEKNSV